MTSAIDRESAEDRLAALPPSAKLVYKTLRYDGPNLTQPEIAAQSRLGKRTVRHALRQLVEADLVTKRTSVQDARQSLYAALSSRVGYSSPCTPVSRR